MARRDRIDPETARVVEQRLQWLLKENGADPNPGLAAGAASSPISDPPAERSASLRSVVAGFRRPHLVIVAAIVTLGIVLAGWAVLRARPVAVAVTPPPVIASRASSAEPTAAAASPSGTVGTVVVHVLGAVRKPGLVSLDAGSRVQDALEAAGGLTGKADPGELNLAQPVTDGQQILVGTRSEPHGEVRDGTGGGGGSGGSGPGSGAAPGDGSAGDGSAGDEGRPVNLNTATQAQLEELPGVGPVMAGRIIAWRTENGRFSRIEELQEIDGVGPKTYAKLAPRCRI